MFRAFARSYIKNVITVLLAAALILSIFTACALRPAEAGTESPDAQGTPVYSDGDSAPDSTAKPTDQPSRVIDGYPADETEPPQETDDHKTIKPSESPGEIVPVPPAVYNPNNNSNTTVPTAKPSTGQQTGTQVDTEGPDLPERDPVDDDFFSDAAFLGNSLVDGFRIFSGLTTCDVFASTSMTVLGVGDLLSQMSQQQYGKVYILLGINEIGYDADYFKGLYGDMLDKIESGQPDADIYIMGLTPVSSQKSSGDSTFNMDRINLYNEKLYELADERGHYYVDLCDALADDTGYLPADVTSDGVHFAASHYTVWRDYLKTHYV